MHDAESSRLHVPGRGMTMVVGAIFLTAGLACAPFGAGAFRASPSTAEGIAAALSIGFLLLGLVVVGLRARLDRAIVEVEHAPDDAVADLPDEPILADGSDTLSGRTHRVVVDGTAGRVEPDPNTLRRKLAPFAALGIAFAAGIVWLMVALRPLDDLTGPENSLAGNLVFALFGVFCLAAAVGLIAWIVVREMTRRATFAWNEDSWSLRSGDLELATGARSALLAVQILAARDRVRQSTGTHVTDTLELDVAWRSDGGVERATLLRSAGPFPHVVALGRSLARQLDLPLVFHATEAHWDREYGRARRRRPRERQRGDGIRGPR